MKYKNHLRNYAIPSGREQALEDFLNQTYQGVNHKQNYKDNSNSEDALTWSCFEVLKHLPPVKRNVVLNEMFEDAFERDGYSWLDADAEPQMHIGKTYTGATTKESTEVDASVELPGQLVFIEAKLYRAISLADPPDTPHDQIAKKLRVGLDAPLGDAREFFFIFLDLAPCKAMYQHNKKDDAQKSGSAYDDKWKSAWWFNYYKHGRNDSMRPLREALHGIDAPPPATVAANMGWLTWASLFKSILRGMV